MKQIFAATALGIAGLALPAQAFDIKDMSDAERAEFGAQVRAYLMENPSIIVEAYTLYEQQQKEAQTAGDAQMVAVNMEALLNDGFSWVGGNPDGDITVVEFLDYRCGYCRKAHDEVAELLSSDGNIRLIVKEFPILGEASLLASQFAIAVKQLSGDEAYKEAHDVMMSYQADLTDANVKRLAKTLELDGDAILERMKSDAVREEIAQTRELAQRLQIRGTPTFVMGDQLVRGYVPIDGMRQIIAEERG